MPAAIVAGSVVALVVLLYFYIAQYIIQDVNGKLDEVKAPVGGFPVVGPWLVNLIGIVQYQLWILRGIFIAQQQGAVNWASHQVSWMIAAVVDHFQGSDLWNHISWQDGMIWYSYNAINTWIVGWINQLIANTGAIYGIAVQARDLGTQAVNSINGWVSYNINLLITNTGIIYAIAIDAQNLGRQAIADLTTWVPGRLDNLDRWREQEQTQVLPRIQADINDRVRTGDFEAMRTRVVELERAVTLLLALGVIAAEGTQAIENLRCISKVNCSALSDVADCDVCDRLNALEIAV